MPVANSTRYRIGSAPPPPPNEGEIRQFVDEDTLAPKGILHDGTVVDFRGPQGEKGDKGDQGEQGIQGVPGDTLAIDELTAKTDLPYDAQAYAHDGTQGKVSMAVLHDSMRKRFSPFLRRCHDKAYSIAQGTAGARMTLLYWGDSVSESLIPPEIRTALYRAWGFAGVWIGAVADFTFSGWAFAGGAASTAGQFSLWPNGQILTIPSGGTASLGLQISPGAWTLPLSQRSIDTFKVLYFNEPGGGTFKLQTRALGADWVDVAEYLSVSTDAPIGLGIATVTVPLAFGTEIRFVALSGTVKAAGVLVLNSTTAGVVQARMGVGGIDMSSSNATNSTILAAALAVFAPDLVLCTFKDNDVGDKLAAQQTLWDAAYPTDWVFIGEYPDQSGDAGGTHARNNEIREHARSIGAYYWDAHPVYVTWAAANARGWYGDVTHLNARGGSVGAALLWRDLGLLDNYQAAATRKVNAPSVRAESAIYLGEHNVGEWLLQSAQAQWLRRGGLRLPNLTAAKVTTGATLTPTTDTTVAVWVRVPAAAVESTVFSLRAGAANNSLEVRMRASDGLAVAYRNASASDTTRTTNAALPYAAHAGQLALVTLTKTAAGVLGLFWNGVQVGANTITPIAGAADLVDSEFLLGAGINATRGDLEVFAAAKWNRVLSQAEILQFLRTGTPSFSGLQVWWPLNEGRGSIAYNAVGVPHGSINTASVWLRPDGSTLTTSATLNFPSIAAAGTSDLTATVTGAAIGDAVTITKADATMPNAGLVLYGQVTAADTVTVRAINITASAIDPASANFRITVHKA